MRLSTGKTRCHTAAAETAELSLLQFWRLDVHDQGVSRAGSFRGLSLSLADGCLLAVSLDGLPSLCVCVLISSYKDTSHPDVY